MKGRLLVIAAHPDDEILGCGGTISRLVKEGYEAYTLILGEGITSRDKKRNRNKRKRELDSLKSQAIKANRTLGVNNIFFCDFADNRFDTMPLLKIINAVEEKMRKIKPDMIFTHYEKDLNIDHQITCKAVITATRPGVSGFMGELYSFEVASSTEWAYPTTFNPDVFFDISQMVAVKIKALRLYRSELREFPHPRSLEGIRLNAQYWGMKTGLKYAEAFKVIRIIK